jgi:excisionase family DNA binding protein
MHLHTYSELREASGGGPLIVKPLAACRLLDCGLTRLYELLDAGELQTFKDGRSRKIVVASIHDYIARRVAAGGPRAA